VSSEISKEARDLINTALAKGHSIQKIAPGVSGNQYTYLWDPVKRQLLSQNPQKYNSGGYRHDPSRIIARRARVLALLTEGVSHKDIAQQLQVTVNVVGNDVAALRLAGSYEPAPKVPTESNRAPRKSRAKSDAEKVPRVLSQTPEAIALRIWRAKRKAEQQEGIGFRREELSTKSKAIWARENRAKKAAANASVQTSTNS
jgi:transposase